MNKQLEFSIEQGLSVQKRHLEFYEKILKPEIYKLVEQKVLEKNNNLKTGFDVCRGTDIDMIVFNIL